MMAASAPMPETSKPRRAGLLPLGCRRLHVAVRALRFNTLQTSHVYLALRAFGLYSPPFQDDNRSHSTAARRVSVPVSSVQSDRLLYSR